MKELLFSLCNKSGVSGAENSVSEYCNAYLSDFANSKIDNKGNVIAIMGDSNNKNNILLDAHIDQIGLIVTYIDKEGFIKAAPCGGVDKRVLLGATYKILGKKELIAVPCTLPPHLINKEQSKIPLSNNLWFDTGLSFEEVSNTINLGDRIVFNTIPAEMIDSRVMSCALDNRAGVCAVLATAKILSNKTLNTTITITLSTQEEINFSGAKTSSFLSNATEAIVVDVSFAYQQGVSSDKCGIMGNGPMIGISPILEKNISNHLAGVAIDKNIPFQYEVMGGPTGTNADVISINKSGISTGLISIPLKNMHTSCEIIDINDIENTSKLIYEYIISKYSQL